MAVLSCLMTLVSVPGHGASAIILDQVDQVGITLTGEVVFPDDAVRFTFRLINDEENSILGFCHGYGIWTHRNGMYTDNFIPPIFDTLPLAWTSNYLSGGLFFGLVSHDGTGVDTIHFGGYDWAGDPRGGIPPGFDQPVWWIETADLVVGDTICVDSSFAPVGCEWVWAWTYDSYDSTFVPGWSGPHCFAVVPCCIGNQGNVNLKGGVDISDLTDLVDYIFPPHDSLACAGAGNVDGQSFAGTPVNVADITYLVNYLFRGGPDPALCPSDK